MGLSLLADEVILQILRYVNPHDLISLRTSSTRFAKIIEQHKHVLCDARAISRDLGRTPLVPSEGQPTSETHPLQQLRTLIRQWTRHRLVEQRLPVILLHG